MPEILLHFIWQRMLFATFPQFTTDGLPIEVLSPGVHNTNAGADFSGARLRIDGQEWCGDIEIHVHASDWNRHHHQTDHAYDNVILHVVRDADCVVFDANGRPLPQCALRYPDDQDWLSRMIEDARRIDSPLHTHLCGQRLLLNPELLTEGWKQTLLRDRLNCKRESINRLLKITQNNWEQAFYITLAHCFGFHVNGIPFEQLAINTPLPYLNKHRNSLFQLTAMLLGQSGLLENVDSIDKNDLIREYSFLQKKFSLRPIQSSMWKYLRLRPQNFPEVRIRQFAQLLYQSEFLFSQLMEAPDIAHLIELFTLHAPTPDPSNDTPHSINVSLPGTLGSDSIRTLIINAVVPYRFAKGGEEAALSLLEALPKENNSIIRQWQTLGQSVHSAADTQALIHLYQNYCTNRQCINCDVAYQIFLS